MARKDRGARGGASAGADAFEAHYAALFGARWPPLRAALTRPPTFAVRLNPHRVGLRERLEAALGHPIDADARYGDAIALDARVDGFADDEAWFLDPASARAAVLVDAGAGLRVLDLCAAPGGKALALADAMIAADGSLDGSLTLNERSDSRRGRLRRAVAAWLPAPAAAAVRITGHDGSRWGLHQPAAYDRVLLDAPCSSEAHVLADAKALAMWTPARTRQLAQRQVALLCAAIDACAPGGRVVYATCALTEAENDGVVARALGKRAGRVALAALDADDPRLRGAERTATGWRWLPDRGGEGPIAVAVLAVAPG